MRKFFGFMCRHIAALTIVAVIAGGATLLPVAADMLSSGPAIDVAVSTAPVVTEAPRISPEMIQGIVTALVALATQFGFGGYAMLAVMLLGLIGAIAGVVAKYLTDGDKPVPWWLAWLPALSSLNVVNQAVGKGGVIKTKPGMLKRLTSKLLVLLLCFSFGLTFAGCPKVGVGGTDRMIQIDASLAAAEVVIETVEENLPEIYTVIDTLCPAADDNPSWCTEAGIIKADLGDTLAIAHTSIVEARSLLAAGQLNDAQEIAGAVTNSIIKLSLLLVRVNAIISRHGGHIGEAPAMKPNVAILEADTFVERYGG